MSRFAAAGQGKRGGKKEKKARYIAYELTRRQEHYQQPFCLFFSVKLKLSSRFLVFKRWRGAREEEEEAERTNSLSYIYIYVDPKVG